MIGIPFNPNNCIFLASQALNANQFDPNVTDTGNLTTHNLLFDTVNNSLIWVDTKTNIIVQETAGTGTGGVTYQYSKVALTWPGLVGPATVTSSFIGFNVPTTTQIKYATITSGNNTNGSFGKSNGVNNDCLTDGRFGQTASFTNSIWVEDKDGVYKGGIFSASPTSFQVFLQKNNKGPSISMSFDIQQ